MDKRSPLALYRSMLLIRAVEERLALSHQQGLVHGACHTYVGQEAVAAGVCAQLADADAVFSTHRGHGHALAKGMQPLRLVAELYGREAGCSGGRGGSMHLFEPAIGMMGTSGIVGPCILQAVGAAYAFRLARLPHVGVAFFGDGAVNNGAFHEGLNMAAIWKLPVLFVCENNQFATEVPFASVAGNPSVAARGAAYRIPSFEIDGNDALAVEQAAREAVEAARLGNGPTLLECRTYRTRPHAEGMGDFTYRTREEVERWKALCPIARLRQHLLDLGMATGPDLDAMAAMAAAEAEAAHVAAVASPFPLASSALAHVLAPASATPPEPQPPTRPARTLSFMKATHEALAEAMARDPRIFVLGEGIGQRGGNFATTSGLHAIHGPERLRDTPICERGFVGLACGAAMAGARPVVDFMFADFLLDAVGPPAFRALAAERRLDDRFGLRLAALLPLFVRRRRRLGFLLLSFGKVLFRQLLQRRLLAGAVSCDRTGRQPDFRLLGFDLGRLRGSWWFLGGRHFGQFDDWLPALPRRLGGGRGLFLFLGAQVNDFGRATLGPAILASRLEPGLDLGSRRLWRGGWRPGQNSGQRRSRLLRRPGVCGRSHRGFSRRLGTGRDGRLSNRRGGRGLGGGRNA